MSGWTLPWGEWAPLPPENYSHRDDIEFTQVGPSAFCARRKEALLEVACYDYLTNLYIVDACEERGEAAVRELIAALGPERPQIRLGIDPEGILPPPTSPPEAGGR